MALPALAARIEMYSLHLLTILMFRWARTTVENKWVCLSISVLCFASKEGKKKESVEKYRIFENNRVHNS